MTGTPTPTETFTLDAYYDHNGQPSHFEMRRLFATVEEAREFAALLPKSSKARAHESRTYVRNADGSIGPDFSLWSVWVGGGLAANGTTGTANETAVKRYRATVKALAKLGVEVDYRTSADNSYPTREDFEAAL